MRFGFDYLEEIDEDEVAGKTDISEITTTDGVVHKVADMTARNDITTIKLSINSQVVYVNLNRDSPIGSHTVKISDEEWENLVNGVDHHVSPIRINFSSSIYTSTSSDTPIAVINSDVIMASTQVMTNISTSGTTEWLFSGTGLIFTGTDIDSYKYVLVRMKLHGVAGSRNAVITVTSLPKS